MIRELRLLFSIVTLLRMVRYLPKLLMLAAVIYVGVKLYQSDVTPSTVKTTVDLWFSNGFSYASKQVTNFIANHKTQLLGVSSPFLVYLLARDLLG